MDPDYLCGLSIIVQFGTPHILEFDTAFNIVGSCKYLYKYAPKQLLISYVDYQIGKCGSFSYEEDFWMQLVKNDYSIAFKVVMEPHFKHMSSIITRGDLDKMHCFKFEKSMDRLINESIFISNLKIFYHIINRTKRDAYKYIKKAVSCNIKKGFYSRKVPVDTFNLIDRYSKYTCIVKRYCASHYTFEELNQIYGNSNPYISNKFHNYAIDARNSDALRWFLEKYKHPPIKALRIYEFVLLNPDNLLWYMASRSQYFEHVISACFKYRTSRLLQQFLSLASGKITPNILTEAVNSGYLPIIQVVYEEAKKNGFYFSDKDLQIAYKRKDAEVAKFILSELSSKETLVRIDTNKNSSSAYTPNTLNLALQMENVNIDSYE